MSVKIHVKSSLGSVDNISLPVFYKCGDDDWAISGNRIAVAFFKLWRNLIGDYMDYDRIFGFGWLSLDRILAKNR